VHHPQRVRLRNVIGDEEVRGELLTTRRSHRSAANANDRSPHPQLDSPSATALPLVRTSVPTSGARQPYTDPRTVEVLPFVRCHHDVEETAVEFWRGRMGESWGQPDPPDMWAVSGALPYTCREFPYPVRRGVRIQGRCG